MMASIAAFAEGSSGPPPGITETRAEAIRTLYAQMRNTSFASVVITTYMVGVSWAFTAHWVILAWAATAIVGNLAREQLIRLFHRRMPADAELERWAAYYVFHQLVVGLIWGSTIFLFGHSDKPITVALTLCCLYSIPAGAVAGQSYTPTSVYMLVATMFALVIARFLSIGGFDYWLLAAATSLYGVTMVGFCRVQHRILMDGFRIRFENRELVEALTTQKADADQARHKAELASLAKSQFLAAASHDLRQPLYALSLFSGSLGELKLDPEGRAVVTRIQDSIGVMESLFEGLLDVSKLDAGVVRARPAEVSVDALFDRLSQVFHPLAVDRGIDLRFRSDGEWVRSDPVLLEQVLSNLVSNAMRCTSRGGVLVAARPRGGQLRLEVWDTGIGIEEADRKRIFEEFVQLANPERDRRKGLGLGLAIAQRSAALIGGRIDVASRPGRGSRFGLSQPRIVPALRDAAAIEVMPTPRSRPISASPVMIVDDDIEVRAALCDLMRRWRIDFEAFAGAEEALRSVEGGQRYRLVLSDYRLGGSANGLDLLAAIAARHPLPAPPMVLITGDFDSDLIGAAHEQGVELLHKPLRPEALRSLVGQPG